MKKRFKKVEMPKVTFNKLKTCSISKPSNKLAICKLLADKTNKLKLLCLVSTALWL